MDKLKSKFKNDKKFRILSIIIVLVIAFIIYTICADTNFNSLGNKSAQKASDVGNDVVDAIDGDNSYSSSNKSTESMNNFDEDVTDENGLSNNDHNFITPENKNQKLIYEGDVELRTNDIDKTYKEISTLMNKYDARVERLDEYTDSMNFTVRITQDNFMKFYNSLSDVSGDLAYSNLSVTDKTKEYSDNTRKIEILKTEYNELKELMKEAKNLEEMLQLKDRLTELSYEIDSYEQSNQNIDYDSQYSTLNISITKYASGAFEKIPFHQELKEAFLNSISIIKHFIVFLVNIWWIILAVALFFYRKKIKKLFKRNKNNNDHDDLEVDLKE